MTNRHLLVFVFFQGQLDLGSLSLFFFIYLRLSNIFISIISFIFIYGVQLKAQVFKISGDWEVLRFMVVYVAIAQLMVVYTHFLKSSL